MQFWPVDETNDVRAIAVHPKFCAVNVTMQVDLLGQCASGSLGSHYVSSTGGQADFMRGAAYSEGGQSFIVTHATAVNGTISRIQATLDAGRGRYHAQEPRRQGRDGARAWPSCAAGRSASAARR